MSRSILTYQLGNYSNFIGSHFWNLHQFDFESGKFRHDELDDDVTFSEGITPTTNQVTFTPRLISWDWKENLGPKIIDDLYESADVGDDEIPQSRRDIKSLSAPAFDGDVAVYSGFTEDELNANKIHSIAKKHYNEWNDFCFSHYHFNSFNKLPKLYRSFNSSNFRLYTQGLQLMESGEMSERMREQTRYFAERCDFLQGFQLLVDCNDAFSGVAMALTNFIHDEYSSGNILAFPTQSACASDDYNMKFNKAVLFQHLNMQTCLWAPLEFTNSMANVMNNSSRLIYKQSDYWTSAVLALGLKTILLPSIIRNHQYDILDYSSLTAGCPNRMCNVGISLPFPIKTSLLDSVQGATDHSNFYQSLNPWNNDLTHDCHNMLGTIYGTSVDPMEIKCRKNCDYKNCNSVNQVMETYIAKNFDISCSGHIRYFDFPKSVVLKHPFPAMFNKHHVNATNGRIKESPAMDDASDPTVDGIVPQTVPVSSVLMSSSKTCEALVKFTDELSYALSRWGHLSNEVQTIEKDELKEKVELFRMMIQ